MDPDRRIQHERTRFDVLLKLSAPSSDTCLPSDQTFVVTEISAPPPADAAPWSSLELSLATSDRIQFCWSIHDLFRRWDSNIISRDEEQRAAEERRDAALVGLAHDRFEKAIDRLKQGSPEEREMLARDAKMAGRALAEVRQSPGIVLVKPFLWPARTPLVARLLQRDPKTLFSRAPMTFVEGPPLTVHLRGLFSRDVG